MPEITKVVKRIVAAKLYFQIPEILKITHIDCDDENESETGFAFEHRFARFQSLISFCFEMV